MNIGSGPAFNAAYQLTSLGEAVLQPSPHYLIHVLNNEAMPIAVPIQTVARGRWSITLTYESLSKRRYESRIMIDAGMLIEVKLREM
jgi:hypothetical protein